MPFLKDRRILVTGGAGFLGRHVCAALRDYSPDELIVPRRAEWDLREPEAVRELLGQTEPHVIVHLAAVVGGIGANRENPGRYFYDNAVMGLHLMEQARLANVDKFVAVGTICSYPKHTPVPFKEQDLWNGYPEETNAPYGLAKKMLLVQAQAYRQQYGFEAITLLPVNLYGPGDNIDPKTSHVIPALIRKVLEAVDSGHESIDVWGTGTATREFLFVRDAAEAIALATESYNKPAPVNIGAGQEISIRDLVELVCDLCAFKGEIRWNATKPDGQPRRCLDTTRAREELGFTASTSLRDGLIETIAWHEKQGVREEGVECQVSGVRQKEDVGCQVSGEEGVAGEQPATRNALPASRNANRATRPRMTDNYQLTIASSYNCLPDASRRRRALVSGITGQDGSYLAELLLAKGYEVHGILRRSSSISSWRLNDIYQDPHESGRRLFLHYGDLTDANSVTGLVFEIEPDEIYNLGAQSHVRVSFDNPLYTVNVGALGTMCVLEAARLLNKRREVRVYQASSSEMFGGEPATVPQSETTPFRPRSPYACAKVFAFHQTVNYREAYDLFACNGILFNHESPRRGETFVTRKITMAAARIREGLQEKLYLGNLKASRDWGFAEDYVDAMWRMLQQEEPDDYVVATGETHSVEQFLAVAFDRVGLDWQDHVEIDPRYYRPSEVDVLCGDAVKARDRLGWEPTTSFEDLVRIMVEADWARAKEEAIVDHARNGQLVGGR